MPNPSNPLPLPKPGNVYGCIDPMEWRWVERFNESLGVLRYSRFGEKGKTVPIEDWQSWAADKQRIIPKENAND